MSALRTKLWRDMAQLRGPILTISLVVGCGIGAFVAMRGTWSSLLQARDSYYERYSFGEVFARAHRVPDAVEASLLELPGVESVYTRVVTGVRLPMPDMIAPATGVVVSLPDEGGQPPFNGIRVTEGRSVMPGDLDEVVVLESFARAHDLEPGARLPIVIEGSLRTFEVVGLANSPEFIFMLPAGEVMAPDDRRFAVVWMSRAAAGPASGMDGAFNDVVVGLQPGASEPVTLAALDRVLAPYGGVGATGRDRQPSHYFLDQELSQLENIASFAPALFLGVAAFVLHVVLGRFVQLQRGEIATLKAVGYTNRAVGGFYLTLASVIVLAGAVVGVGVGALLGRGTVGLYMDFFRLPALEFRMTWQLILSAVSSSLAAGLFGTFITMRAVMRLPPAEAMRPAAPTVYRAEPRIVTLLMRPVAVLFGPSVRMVLREVSRRPLRFASSVAAVSLAVGILLMGRSFVDAMSYLVDDYLPSTQREDVTVTFDMPRPPRALGELGAIPGVTRAEGMRALPARLRSGYRSREVVALGMPEGLTLRAVRDAEGRRVVLPEKGALLTSALAELLDVGPGDALILEPLEGDRRPREFRIAGLVDEMFGLQAYFRTEELHRLLGETPTVSTAMLSVETGSEAEVLERLEELPMVAGAGRLDDTLASFREQSAASTEVSSMIMTLFAITIVIGVIYNNARVAVSIRGRELASLRVLGFTRGEISAILNLELALQVALAIPIGWALGYAMIAGLLGSADQEAFRLAPIVSLNTYAVATGITLAAGAASAVFVRRQLSALDLVGVLKTRE